VRAFSLAGLWDTLGRPRESDAPPRPADAVAVAFFALVLRAVVVLYAARRFPPADDGAFYDVVAGRIARGLGYTWAWPDGAVTYAAHYPVGYPALIGLGYAVFGAHPGVAMGLNAFIGALGAGATYLLAGRVASRWGALLSGLFVACEPALVLYTPALMTEAVAGELVVIAAASASSGRGTVFVRGIVAGLVTGIGMLVRPQLLLAAPAIGALLAWRRPSARASGRGALAVTALAVAVCLPWTLRNCEKLDTCAFVSANGGWNLFIGASPLGDGGWASLEQIGVPPECRTVFAEGAKDRCFGRAGVRAIAAAPLAWLALVPKKLAVTFDYGTAAAHYLNASNPALVTDAAKVAIGAAELFGQRVLLIAATLGLGVAPGQRSRLRRALVPVAVLAALAPFGWVAWLCVLVQSLLFGRETWRLPSVVFALALIATTALTHAVFFGAGRYALVCLPALALLAALGFPRVPGRVADAPAGERAGVARD
jgi:4-amino-4-deoxy-L-arabinose transferase-like glycosyltransferase